MQPYHIQSFRRTTDGAIFTRQETGTHSGGYTFGTEVKRLRDFICDGTFTINSVLRTSGNVTFTVGDFLTNTITGIPAGTRARIASIKVDQSEIVLVCGNIHQTIRLTNAIKYVEPVAITIQTPARRGPGRPTNAEIAARNNNQNTAFSAVQTAIERNNPRPVRVQGILKRRRETLEEFLVKFFKVWNSEKNTIFVDDSNIQTAAGKRRSLGDVYMICKYYYPDCTLNEVLNLLYNVLPRTITTGFRTSYCFTINKRVWYYSEGSGNNVADRTQNDEFGNQHQFYLNNITA